MLVSQRDCQAYTKKVSSRVRGLLRPPTRTFALPVYRADLNHPVNIAEHGKAVRSARRVVGQTSPQGRVRGHSIGMTEKAKASGNALDMPTSVWSEMARKQVEPKLNSEKQMTASACWLMRPGTAAQGGGATAAACDYCQVVRFRIVVPNSGSAKDHERPTL